MDNNNFSEYIRLLYQLHLCSVLDIDQVDDDIADKIRDEMDYYWYNLTKDEMHLANDISAGLWLLKEKDDK
jgi:hypothetical protein